MCRRELQHKSNALLFIYISDLGVDVKYPVRDVSTDIGVINQTQAEILIYIFTGEFALPNLVKVHILIFRTTTNVCLTNLIIIVNSVFIIFIFKLKNKRQNQCT